MTLQQAFRYMNVLTYLLSYLIVHSFEKFRLEGHSRCAFDSVSIYNGKMINSSRLIARYCGYTIPPDVVSSGSTVVVNFATDSSVMREGFFARYTSVYGKSLLL